MSKSSHRGLSEHLRELPDEKLAALLRARPDLATPRPTDISVLASRAHTRSSVARVLDQLDQYTLQVLDALRLSPERSTPLATLRNLVSDGDLDGAIATLVDLVIAWPDGDALRITGGVDEVSSPYPAGLGRPIGALVPGHSTAQLAPVLESLHLPPTRQPEATTLLVEAFSDAKRVRTLIEVSPPEARAVLYRLAPGPPLGSVRDAKRIVKASNADSPVRWLLAHGLLVAISEDTVELPREVGLVLRGDSPLGTLNPQPPTVDVTTHAMSVVDSSGAGQVLEFLRLIESLLNAVADEPPSVLRAGGMGVRDLRRLARQISVDERVAALLLEIGYQSELLDQTDDVDPEWLPTDAFDVWRSDSSERRWTQLARTWMSMGRLPGLIGQRDDKERLVAPLSYEVGRFNAPAIRLRTLRTIAELPAGAAVAVSDILAVLSWHAPRMGGPHRDNAIGWAYDEAALLGITGRGAMTSYGRKLLAGEEPAQRLATLIPAPLDHVLVQADLTVVAPGPLEPELAAELALIADVESAGSATVYRVSPASVRRALDAGRSAADLHALFAERSRTPAPQSLTYLIDDVARRHGGLRVGAAISYLRSDDEALLSEILADRACAPLRLRRLAPTVLTSTAPLARLLEVLRDTGYAPVAENASGGVVLTPSEKPRTATRHRPTPADTDVSTLDESHFLDAVRAIRRGDELSRAAHRAPVTLDTVPDASTTLAVLQQAARERHRVQLSYVDPHGGIATRVVRPASIGAGYLRAEDDRTEVLHTFALHRITSAVLADG